MQQKQKKKTTQCHFSAERGCLSFKTFLLNLDSTLKNAKKFSMTFYWLLKNLIKNMSILAEIRGYTVEDVILRSPAKFLLLLTYKEMNSLLIIVVVSF